MKSLERSERYTYKDGERFSSSSARESLYIGPAIDANLNFRVRSQECFLLGAGFPATRDVEHDARVTIQIPYGIFFPLQISPEPNFVGSFDIGSHVFFFFRETAVEYINCGKSVYSRVARVCKRDTGGKNILAQNWATYLKARLNCSIPGEFPFYFNEIRE